MGNVSGICAPCLNQVDAESVDLAGSSKQQQKLRPLLADLEADFKEFAGDDGVLDVKELGEIWKKCAMRKLGKLTDEDVLLIEKSSKDYFHQLDIQCDGKVSYEEFTSYMMGGHEARGPLQDMRKKLQESLKKDPTTLRRLIDSFKEWDKNGDGFVTPEELDQVLAEMEAKVEDESDITKSEALQGKRDKLRRMRDEIFKEADVDNDGRVDLWEVMAHMLGRRKIPVEILLYDISKGMAEKLGKLLIGKKVAAVHSGLLVYGSEYWYGGQVFRSDPPCNKVFGWPLTAPWDAPLQMSEQRPDLPVVRVGYTFATHAEFTRWLKSDVTARYNHLSQYDLFTHSCNHFTNEAVQFLTGSPIPEKIFELQRMAMTPTMLAMRPVLNKYLGGFGEAGHDVDEHFFTVDDMPDMVKSASQAALLTDVLDAGKIVFVDGLKGASGPVVATILSQVDGVCEVKYFCSDTGDIKRVSGIKSTQIRPLSEVHT